MPATLGHRNGMTTTERPAEAGDLRLATICVNATDRDHAADFWSETARAHIDLYNSERDRHVGRGPTLPDEWPYPEVHDFVVLRDPEGNEFCVIAA